MKTFTIKLAWDTPYEVYIEKRKYSNGRVSLQLIDVTDGMPHSVATVNLPDVLLADNEVLIKDYSENDGMLNFLTENNIVIPTERGVQSGHVWVPVAILNPESSWGQLDPTPEEINTDNGLSMWTINGYRIWANSYKEALHLLPMIESF
jgi:hypothetical protein